ncbi:MAG: hypothetical protein Q9216_003369 [Gyalolechia sp. 2 TL-2023]
MDNYGGMGMSSFFSSSMPVGNVDAETYRGVLPSLGIPEQITPSYDTSDFTINDEMNYMQTALPQDPQSQYNAYEEAFAETLGLVESMPPDQPPSEDSSIDRDNKLLSFQPPTYSFTLLDISLRCTGVSMAASLHGMFFMAELPDQGPHSPAAPTELTCYRRNLFQVTGSITLPRSLRYIMTDNGDRIPIIGQELYISATESVEGNPVRLISVPWKTPASNNQNTPEDKIEKEPAPLPLDTMSNQDMDAGFATFPIAWKRLQFRVATANNGRRKELQQHFVVRLQVVATLSTGARVAICDSRSNAIIVRGRSPRNFQARKDHPVGTVGASCRRAPVTQPAAVSRNSTDSSHQPKVEKSPDGGKPATLDNQEISTPSTFSGWNRKPNTGSASKTSTLPPPALPHSSAGSTSTDPSTLQRPKDPSPEKDPAPPPPSQRSAKSARLTSMPTTSNSNTSTSTASISSPSSSTTITKTSTNNPVVFASTSRADAHANLLYEYFPLGLDDWQHPVDAVYRPHVVHHISDATGGGARGELGGKMGRPSLGGKSKRYFSEDGSKVA